MRRPLWAAALCLAALIAVWLQFASPSSEAPSVTDDTGRELTQGEELTVTGRVYRLETRSVYEQETLQIYLDSISILRQDSSGVLQESRISNSLICETLSGDRPMLGSTLQLTGQFSYFSTATNPGEFDTAQYYRILGIGGTLKKAVIEKAGKRYSYLREQLYRLKLIFEKRLYSCFPEKEASILCTMLLGDKTSLDSEIKELYKRNGIIHILSISGLHITLIGMGIYRMLRKCGCPLYGAAAAGGILLLLYGGLTGMGVSACRAIGMYLIRMLGECLGRTYDMLTALGVMGVIMLLRQPEYLRHSGFLLSFGSICGIGVLLPAMPVIHHAKGLGKRPCKNSASENGGVFKGAARKIRNRWEAVWAGVGQSLCAGIAITLFTLPIHLCFYYEIPVYSVFLNLLVLPFVGIAMVTGLLIMLVPGMGFLSWADRLIFGGYEVLCRAFDSLPCHTWTAGCPALWQVAVYYGLILLLAAAGRKWKNRWKVLVLAGAVVLLGVRLRDTLTVTFLDVGQGDGICLETSGGEVYLFDGGSSTEKQLGKYTLIPFLKYRGIDHVDGVFISHPDTDHCSAVLELLEIGGQNGITVDRLVLPAIDPGKRQEELGKLVEGARTSGQKIPVKISYIAAGNSWNSKSIRFTCLHPSRGYVPDGANAYSECFFVTCGEFSMLLTGDVEGEGEEALLEELKKRRIGDITVLKVAHHGSRNSTPPELVQMLNPCISIISCGADNSYGHPHKELLDRLLQTDTVVLKTPLTGAVQLRTDGRTLKISKFLKEEDDIDRENSPHYN